MTTMNGNKWLQWLNKWLKWLNKWLNILVTNENQWHKWLNKWPVDNTDD